MSEPASVVESIIIPTNLKPVEYKYYNGELTPYIYAFVDGTAKYIPVSKDASLNGTLSVLSQDGKAVNSLFDEKLCVYAIDKYGIYHIRGLGSAVDINGDYVGLSTSGSSLYNGTNENVMLIKENAPVVSNVQRFDGDNNEDTIYLGSREGTTYDSVFPTELTKVIVRTYFTESDTYEWATYDYDALMLMGLANEGYVNIGHNIPTESLSYVLNRTV